MKNASVPFLLSKSNEKSLSISAKKYHIISVPLHWHNFYEIELVIDGVGKHYINGEEHDWKTGEMHLLRLTDFHEIKLEGKGELHLIQILPSHLPEDILKIISLNRGNLITNLSQKNFSYANTLCLILEDELSKGEKCNHDLVSHLLSAIVMLFLDSLGAPFDEQNDYGSDLIGRIVLYINENFRHKLTLEEIAEHFFISKNHLCNYFKKQMNTTIISYIRALRLEYAEKLTHHTKLKSVEISKACGYGSISNFLRDFKKQYGVSPLDMRKKSKNKE